MVLTRESDYLQAMSSDGVRSKDGGPSKGGERSEKSSARCRWCTPEAVVKQVAHCKPP